MKVLRVQFYESYDQYVRGYKSRESKKYDYYSTFDAKVGDVAVVIVGVNGKAGVPKTAKVVEIIEELGDHGATKFVAGVVDLSSYVDLDKARVEYVRSRQRLQQKVSALQERKLFESLIGDDPEAAELLGRMKKFEEQFGVAAYAGPSAAAVRAVKNRLKIDEQIEADEDDGA